MVIISILGNRSDFIQLMLDSEIKSDEELNDQGSKLTSDEIIAQGIVFIIGGYDTTSTALSHVVFHLSQNKDCERRLYEELKEVKDFSFENLKRLKYLNAVLNETLRLSPPILRYQRKNIRDFDLKGNYLR